MVEELKQFVKHYYKEKDSAHDLSHIERVLDKAEELSESREVDRQAIKAGAYLHGIVYKEDLEQKARQQLQEIGFEKSKAERIIKVAKESQKEAEPETLEGKILHDAHLLEGGKTFHIVKSFMVGGARGQTVEETVEYLEENILGEFECCLPEAEEKYREKEQYANGFLEQLKKDL